MNWKVIFSGINWLFWNFESLNKLIFIICLCELCSKSKWKSSGRNASSFRFSCCENNIETMSTLCQNDPPSFYSFSISPDFSVTLSHIIESIKMVLRLRHHIQVGRLPFQGFWLGLVIQFVIWESMWSTGQTSNNPVINRWWSLALPYPNSD